MAYHHPIDDRIELFGATLIPRNWDASADPTDDVTVHATVPERGIDAKRQLDNTGDD